MKLIFVALFCLANALNRGARKIPVWYSLASTQQQCFLEIYKDQEVMDQITNCRYTEAFGVCEERDMVSKFHQHFMSSFFELK